MNLPLDEINGWICIHLFLDATEDASVKTRNGLSVVGTNEIFYLKSQKERIVKLLGEGLNKNI